MQWRYRNKNGIRKVGGSMKFANIIVDISHEKLDRPFTYRIPEELQDLVVIGSQVEVPFGKGDRTISGYVIDIVDTVDYALDKIKEIRDIKKGSINIESQLIGLAWWMKEHYGSTMNQALKTVIPVKKTVKRIEKNFISLAVGKERALELINEYSRKKNTQARARLLSTLLQQKELAQEQVIEELAISAAVIRAMETSGQITIRKAGVLRNPIQGDFEIGYTIQLNEAQNRVIGEIMEAPGKVHLLFGVTGSGKTEVYMELIQKTIEQGKEAIVLIPEIGLTYQTIRRFYQRFGNQVSIMNSRLSQGERYDQFEAAKEGEVKIMVGPRSALFTPFRNLGLIIIDEEHEGAYKSDKVPKYHARETAIYRAGSTGATVVLGSATPSVDSFHKAKQGEYYLHTLTRRANEHALPETVLVDMRQELQEGNREIFSRDLLKAIGKRLERKEQVMLFINRRGYSGFVSCRECGKPVKCPHCDVSLTLHTEFGDERLICHYCNYQIPMPKNCPACHSKYLGRFGIGTQQVEQRIWALFPEARTLRMDFDTTREKHGHEKILETFAKREADILIGTQMIVKGHDFPYVTLVGVIAADLSLYAPDYLAGERTFQLLTQAIGRAGRGEQPGAAIIQTYNPEETIIQNAMNQDYEEFYDNEMFYRGLAGYPPASHMLAILVADKNEAMVEHATKDIGKRIENSKIDGLQIIGPAKAGISKISDVYRYVIYLKHTEEDVLIQIKNRLQLYWNRVEAYKKLTIQFDFNPMNGY